MNLQIVEADESYLLKLYELHNLANDIDKWTNSKFQQVFDCELPVLILKDGERIIGFIIYLVCLDEVRIINVSVHPEERKRGYAKKLLLHVLLVAKENNWRYVLLDVRVSNVAVNLYANLGFRILAVRKNFYDTNPEDAYFMQLELEEFNFAKYQSYFVDNIIGKAEFDNLSVV